MRASVGLEDQTPRARAGPVLELGVFMTFRVASQKIGITNVSEQGWSSESDWATPNIGRGDLTNSGRAM
jgi:hypothetical protein